MNFLTRCVYAGAISTLWYLPALAEDSKADTPPKVEQLSESLYQMGKIQFNSAKKEIYIPCVLKHDKVIIEYVLTTEMGKVHETLFLTDIKPFNLNVVLKLLSFQASKELFPVLDKNFVATNKLHEATEDEKRHSRFTVNVSWESDGDTVNFPLEELFLHTDGSGATMPPAPWIYGGSYMHRGRFKADINGDIIAILTDRTAMANYSGETRSDDTLWVPNKPLLPAVGTPITLTLKKTETNQ
ncbi:YdjY domain-containing protein [Rubritalea marina]|uniref:YdjY domain-containing protein n=1 Tax=Rubritalea marina TaxID=361055 RepID=UPI0012EA1BA5|nr:YdjY domain-containing protein [Rubritalea marina]